MAAPLAALLPGTTAVRLTEAAAAEGATVVAAAAGRPLVLVVRDLHRHAWMGTLVRGALAAAPGRGGRRARRAGRGGRRDPHRHPRRDPGLSGLAAAELLAGTRR